MRHRLFAAAALAGALAFAPAIAAAAPTPLVTPPAGWHEDPEISSQLSMKEAATQPFGDTPTTSAVQAYFPASPGIGLYVTRSSAQTGTAHGAAARAALDAFDNAPERAKLLGGTITVGARDQSDAASQHVATLTWIDTALKVTTTTRLVIAASAQGLVAVSGECVYEVRDQALIDACTKALATIDTGVPAADRVPVVIAATAAAPPAPAAQPSRIHREPARLDDGTKLHMEVAPSKRGTDMRPVYVGAGVLVLALIFWWNRRRRGKDELYDR
jgi:hypothetical protein